VQILVNQQSSISNVSRQYCGWEEGESQDAFPDLQYTGTGNRQDNVEPYVGEDAPSGGDEENAQMFYLPGLTIGNHKDA